MIKTDVAIVGSGVAGLYCALNLPRELNITVFTKDSAERSDSFLAQGGICVLKNENDYDSFFEDTMKAGHYKNRTESVDIMIKSSRAVINDLVDYGVRFERNEDGEFKYTREGGHSTERILFHEDVTGKEITSTLLERVKELDNVKIVEKFTMIDIIEEDNTCYGIVGVDEKGNVVPVLSSFVVWATGGIGGLYKDSTNYRHLTGDALAISLRHNIKLEDIDYVQIHPTAFYLEKYGRRFLISESCRGEGALLRDKNMERFTDELKPRDVVAKAIYAQMEKDGTNHVWLDLTPIGEDVIKTHFPNIYKKCLDHGFDVTKECIPITPAQHYFMGGVWIDKYGRTSMERLYSAGETACNGVHGANRLASNSLLEALVFAKRAADDIAKNYPVTTKEFDTDAILGSECYKDVDKLMDEYKKSVLDEIEKERKNRE